MPMCGLRELSKSQQLASRRAHAYCVLGGGVGGGVGGGGCVREVGAGGGCGGGGGGGGGAGGGGVGGGGGGGGGVCGGGGDGGAYWPTRPRPTGAGVASGRAVP